MRLRRKEPAAGPAGVPKGGQGGVAQPGEDQGPRAAQAGTGLADHPAASTEQPVAERFVPPGGLAGGGLPRHLQPYAAEVDEWRQQAIAMRQGRHLGS